MSAIWPKFTQENPCPACGHWDWTCRAGDKVFLCMRVQSPKAARDGGWYHAYADKPKPYLPPPPAAPLPPRDWSTLLSLWSNATAQDALYAFAASIGVSSASLLSLGCAYSHAHAAWAFPMRNGDGAIVGIRLRWEDGQKKAVTGSHQGLFIPNTPSSGMAWLLEGPTDTAAALTIGLFAIGRPSCNGGEQFIRVALNRLKIRRAVIVSDCDRKHRTTGEEWNPGLDGAQRLEKELHKHGIKTVVFTPPAKDFREFLRQGATRTVLESLIKDLCWNC